MPPDAGPPWVLALLAPFTDEISERVLGGLPFDVRRPAGDDIADVLGAAEIVVGDWRLARLGLSADLVAGADRLAFVLQPSVGVQAHDAGALAAAEVPLANIAGFNAVSVAEWALGAALSVTRLLGWSEGELRAGTWPQTEVADRGSRELAGRPVGVLGFGPVGRACAVRFAALGCPVSYWSRRRRPPAAEDGARYRDLDELIAASEVLVVALPITPDTRGLLDAGRLATLPAGAALVVCSRGGIVDEDTVAAALDAGRLGAAAFDVYATEPLPAGSPLRRAPNALLTPHTAGNTVEAVERLYDALRANLERAVAGAPVLDVVNGVDPVVRRRS